MCRKLKYAKAVVAVGCALLLRVPAAADVVDLEIDGDTVTASLELPGGVGADLELVFEDVVGLSAASLGLDVELVDPLDPGLLSRLPGGISVPGAFPMLVRIEPPPTGPLTFSGVYSLNLHTHNLSYSESSPLRLFRAPLGGNFRDITEWMGQGSYRVRGSEGGFSEFMIVVDMRDLDVLIDRKFDGLEGLLDDVAGLMSGTAAADLSAILDAAYDAYGWGDLVQAIEEMESFEATVVALSPTDIPDTWRADGTLRNAAGELRGAALTVRSSLVNRSNAGP